jgi:excisionase family DNA binding protein
LKKAGIDWSKEPMLGKVPDAELAKVLGVSRQSVSQGRAKIGIPAYKTSLETKLKPDVEEAQEELTGNVEVEEVSSDLAEETSRPEAIKEERRKEARREAQKTAATLEGTAKAADPLEVEKAKGIVSELLSDAAVAVALGTTKFTVQRYIREGKLHAIKIGGAWKIPAEALKRFLSGE